MSAVVTFTSYKPPFAGYENPDGPGLDLDFKGVELCRPEGNGSAPWLLPLGARVVGVLHDLPEWKGHSFGETLGRNKIRLTLKPGADVEEAISQLTRNLARILGNHTRFVTELGPAS